MFQVFKGNVGRVNGCTEGMMKKYATRENKYTQVESRVRSCKSVTVKLHIYVLLGLRLGILERG